MAGHKREGAKVSWNSAAKTSLRVTRVLKLLVKIGRALMYAEFLVAANLAVDVLLGIAFIGKNYRTIYGKCR